LKLEAWSLKPMTSLASLGDEYWQWVLRTEPTWATYLADPRYNDQLPRVGPADIDRQTGELRGLLDRVEAVDPKALGEADRVTHGILHHLVTSQIEERGHKFHQWNVDQMMGPQVWLLELINFHPFKIEKDVLDLIARFQAFPEHLEGYVANLRDGLAEGRVAPRIAVTRVIGQLEALLATPPEKSPLALALEKRPAAASSLDDRLLAAIRGAVYPAYAKFLAFLKSGYAPKAREEVGVWATTGGEAAYAFRVRHHTTTRLTPDELHEIGHEELRSILGEMQAIARKLGHAGDVKSFFAKLMADPANFWPTREGILRHFERILEKCSAALPRAFGHLPKTKCIVKSIEEYREKDCVAAFYYQPPEDLSRPGIFYANTYKPETRLKCNNAALTVHEAVPGHHLQIAISVEMKDLPMFRRHSSFTAFVEGWALYSERLADEMGLYEGDLERFGMLTYQAWRACRLVVDTGLHAKKWTRDRAIDFFRTNIALGDTEIVNEVDRYIIWPGQALAYKVGQREISRLREEARKEMGSRFDLRDFHDVVLRNGALPLTTLGETVRRWAVSGDT
jgi:prolyl oligopeptidase